MKKTFAALGLGLGLIASNASFASQTAATTTTTQQAGTSSSTLEQLKASPFKLMVANYLTATRSDANNDISNVKDMFRIQFGYKLTDKDMFTLDNRFLYSKDKGKDADSSYNRIQLAYSRKLLTEKEDGLNLSAGTGFRFLPDTKVRNTVNSPGFAFASLSISKKLGNLELTFNNYVRYGVRTSSALNKQPKSGTMQWGYLGELVQEYSFNDTVSLYLYEMLYTKNKHESGIKASSTLDLEIGSNIKLANNALTINPYIIYEGAMTDKTTGFKKDFLKEPTFGLFVKYSVF